MTWDAMMTLGLDAVWQSTAVAIVALAAVRLARRQPAAIRQAILTVALLKFLTPPLSIVPLGVFALVPRPQPTATVAVAASAPAIDAVSWVPLAVAAYIAGAVIVFSLVLISMIRVARLRRASRVASDATRQLTTSLAGLIGVRRPVSVIVSDNAVAAPMAIGILKPAVVVPRTLEESLDLGELRAVIGHELAHHRRGDLLWAWVRSAACAIWWWHPVVWMVSKALRHVQEELCDDEVIRAGVIERDAYCDVLLRAAAIGAPLGVGAAFGDRRHPLADRVERLMTGQGSSRVRPLVARATAVALACALLPGVRHEAVEAARASAPVPGAPVPSPAVRVTPMQSSETPGKPAPLKRSNPAAKPQNFADGAHAAASSFADVADRVFDEISTTIESVIDPRPGEVEEIVAAEIRAHLSVLSERQRDSAERVEGPPQSAEHVVASSDGVEPQMRQFVRGFRNGLRSTTRNFWRNLGRGMGRSLKLLTGGIGSSSGSPSPSPSPSPSQSR